MRKTILGLFLGVLVVSSAALCCNGKERSVSFDDKLKMLASTVESNNSVYVDNVLVGGDYNFNTLDIDYCEFETDGESLYITTNNF